MTEDKVSLVREHTISEEIPLHTATATFTDDDDKTYTFHKKEIKNGVIILYMYDTENITANKTDFCNFSIDTDTQHFRESIPFPPQIEPEDKTEKTIISLGTCKDFTITNTETETITYDNWGASTTMSKEAALAYQSHFGQDKIKIK